MSKKEFLDILRQALTGEVSSDIIEQNIKYYEQYISSSSSKEEAKIIEMLGNPRLIARTIIESEKAAQQKGKTYSNEGYRSSRSNEDRMKSEQNSSSKGRTKFFTNLSWRYKLVLALILIILILLAVIIGRIIVRLFIPIIIIVLLLSLFRKRY